MANKDFERLEARAIGKVQGVYYRAFVVSHANALGVVGYAKNLPDGSVEVVAEGGRKKLELLVAELEKGPSASRVLRIVKNFGPAIGEFESFSIKY
ncbi:MAG: acylphosphatase [archaeon]|nr:acylphosphatase [archaeon]